MNREELKKRLENRDEVTAADDTNVEEIASVVEVSLPNVSAPRRTRKYRRSGFWNEQVTKCEHLPVNQAVKVKLVDGEFPTNVKAACRSIARAKGFYLNCVYKYPYMYLWPDRMSGRIRPEDYSDKGAVIFEKEEESK